MHLPYGVCGDVMGSVPSYFLADSQILITFIHT